MPCRYPALYLGQVNPELIYGLPQALKEIESLRAKERDLQSERQAERLVMARVIMELEEERKKAADLQKINEEKDAFAECLKKRITDLEEERESLLQQIAEGIKKGWQMQDLQRMIFGRSSERFVPTEPANNNPSSFTGHKTLQRLSTSTNKPQTDFVFALIDVNFS